VPFTDFDAGEPHDFGPAGEDCLELQPPRKMNDNTCTAAQPAFCGP
jgi:hypothetical protein